MITNEMFLLTYISSLGASRDLFFFFFKGSVLISLGKCLTGILNHNMQGSGWEVEQAEEPRGVPKPVSLGQWGGGYFKPAQATPSPPLLSHRQVLRVTSPGGILWDYQINNFVKQE